MLKKKLNDFIDKANQLGEQLNKISGIEIGGNVDTSSLKEFEKHLEAIQKKTNRMDSINIFNSKDMKQQMSHLESYERNLDRIRKEFYSLPEGSVSSVTASGYKGIIDKYSNGIAELQEKIQSFESNITATKELLSKSIKNGGIANLLNSDEDLSSRRNYNKLTRFKRYVLSLQNQDPDNFFDTKSIIEAGEQFSKKIQPLIDMLSNKSFDDSAFEAMRSNLESIGVSADNLKKKLQDMFKVEQQGAGGGVSSPTTPTTSAGGENSGTRKRKRRNNSYREHDGYIVPTEGKNSSKLKKERLLWGDTNDIDTELKSKLEKNVQELLGDDGLTVDTISATGKSTSKRGVEILTAQLTAFNKEMTKSITLTARFNKNTGELRDISSIKYTDTSNKKKKQEEKKSQEEAKREAKSANKKSQKYTDDQYRQSINEQIKLEKDLYEAEQNRDKNTGSKKDQYTKEVASLQKLIQYEKDYRDALTATTEAKTQADAKLQKEQDKLGIKRDNSSSAADIAKALTEEQKQVGDRYKKNLLGRYSGDEITGLASATGKIEAYASAVEGAKNKYQELVEYTDSHDMSSKDNQTAADKLANNLDKTLKDLGSEKFDSFNTKGSFFKSFSGNLADVRQEVNKLLSGYEEIDQATIKWSTNQKSLTYVMQDTDGIMKKFRLNLEKTADGFNARTIELGKQTGFDKFADMISNGFSAGANGITKVVDMYASVQDMINYAKQGIDVFKEYDAALTDISYTTEGTKEQISAMGKSYVQLAKDMSTSVEDSMKVASIYANLQTSSEEVMQSVKPTLLLANATGADASNASDQIQGILEQFDIGTDQAEHVVDVLENVSSNLKEDFGKAINNVTEGVSAVGQTAADAGFTFEQLAAMIGKVSEKTRDSGSEIGNSLKTILTRISKASSLTDEVDNETISKAAKSLHEVGVEVYEQDGTFRNFLTILGELKEKWDDLSDSQQADDFAWVFGNKYQRTYLIAGNALESCTTIIRKLDYEGLTTQELAVHATKLLSAA